MGIDNQTDGWSESLQSNEEGAKMFNTAKQMRKERKDIVGSKYVRNENGTLKVKEEKVMERWKSYFSFLINKTLSFTWDRITDGVKLCVLL